MSTGDMTQVRFLHDLTFQLATKIPKAIIMPDDVAAEKVLALQALGAEVERVRPSSIVDKKQVSLLFALVTERVSLAMI
jgi:cysteine synthase